MKILIALVVMTTFAGTAKAEEEHSFWWYTKAKLACLPDVTRLCASAMPDEGKVRDCMKNKRQLVSARCAEFYPGGTNAN